MTLPSGNSECSLPSTHNVPLGFASGNIERVLGKQNSMLTDRKQFCCHKLARVVLLSASRPDWFATLVAYAVINHM